MVLNRVSDIMSAILVFMKANFPMETFMEMEFSPMQIIGNTMANGKTDLSKGSECLLGQMAIDTKANT